MKKRQQIEKEENEKTKKPENNAPLKSQKRKEKKSVRRLSMFPCHFSIRYPISITGRRTDKGLWDHIRPLFDYIQQSEDKTKD